MKFRKLELINFRQFYGKQEISFSTDVNKNVTLIHAENGTGKTAFLNAILWCFFDITTDNFSEPKSLLNKIAKSSGENSYRVTIEFEDEDLVVYSATRSTSSLGSNVFKVFKLDGNSYSEIPNPDSFINSVIPKDISKYFFFQGEGIGKVAGEKGGAVVKHAVKEILGFTIAEKAREDLVKIKKEYQSALANADNTGEISKLQKEVTRLEDSISQKERHREEAVNAIELYESKLNDIDTILENSDSNVVRTLHEERSRIESRKRREESLWSDAKRKRITLISEFATTVFGFELAGQAMDFIDEAEYKGSIPSPYNEQLINDIISAKECICGAELNAGSSAFNKIQSMLRKAGDPKLESRVGKARSQLTQMRSDAKKAKREFEDNLKQLNDSEEQIAKLTKELDDLSVKLKGTKSLEDIRRIESERSTLKQKSMEANRALGSIDSSLKREAEELAKYKLNMSKITLRSGDVIRFGKLVDASEAIDRVLKKTLESTWGDVGLRIIEKVNTQLSRFVRQDYTAKLNPNTFEIKLIDREGRLVPTSDGQSLLLSLTFISALIDYSRDRRNASGQILTPGAVAPFIIDAPFGVLDNKYKGHVASAIPESVGQVVLLLSSSHWEGAVEEGIRARVGREYNMVLEESSDLNNKMQDSINILGQSYETVRYGCPIDRTVIEEVGSYA